MNPLSTLNIILIVIGFLLFIFFGVLVPVFTSTNRAKLKHFHYLSEKYGLDNRNKMKYFSIVNPIIEGSYNNRKLQLSTVLSRNFYPYQRYSIPLTVIELTLRTPTLFSVNISPNSGIANRESQIITGVQEFDRNFIVQSDNTYLATQIFSTVLTDKILMLKKRYGKKSIHFSIRNSLLTNTCPDPITTLKRRDRTEMMIEILILIAERTELIAGDYQSGVPYRS